MVSVPLKELYTAPKKSSTTTFEITSSSEDYTSPKRSFTSRAIFFSEEKRFFLP